MQRSFKMKQAKEFIVVNIIEFSYGIKDIIFENIKPNIKKEIENMTWGDLEINMLYISIKKIINSNKSV